MGMLKYSLRRGRPADARIVRKLFLAIVVEHGLVAVEAPHLDVDLATFGEREHGRDDFVVVSGGKVVGFAIVVAALAGRRGELLKLFVRRSHRGRGVGTMLLERATQAAKTRGHDSLRLTTTEAFRAAHGYYERRGWVRESSDGAMPIIYGLRLRELPAQVPAHLLPPIPRLLEAILVMLEWATSHLARVEGRRARGLSVAKPDVRGP